MCKAGDETVISAWSTYPTVLGTWMAVDWRVWGRVAVASDDRPAYDQRHVSNGAGSWQGGHSGLGVQGEAARAEDQGK